MISISPSLEEETYVKCVKELVSLGQCCPFISNQKQYQGNCNAILEKGVKQEPRLRFSFIICYVDCYFAHNKLIKDGQFERNEIIQLYTKTSPKFTDVIPLAVDKCIKECKISVYFRNLHVSLIPKSRLVKAKNLNVTHSPQEKQICSNSAYLMNICMIGVFQRVSSHILQSKAQ